MKLENWPIEKFIEYTRNPRKNDHAVQSVAKAIKEFGFKVPVLATSDGSVIDGHLRLKAAKFLELTEVPVLIADDLTDTQIKAFRLSVNKLSELATWDFELLTEELEELKIESLDLTTLGFSDFDFKRLERQFAKQIKNENKLTSESCEVDTDSLGDFLKCPKCGFLIEDR